MRFLIFIGLFLTYTCYAQNLVPNPSFEGYDPYGSGTTPFYYSNITNTPCNTSCCWSSLPEFLGKVNGATNNWWTVNRGGIPDVYDNYYFNECTIELFEGIQQQQGTPISHDWYKPRTGEAFVVLYTYGDQYYINSTSELRSYTQVKLTEPLKAGYKYEIACYALLTTNLHYHLYGPFSFESQASDGLGMYLSKDSIYGSAASNVLTNFTPQVSNPSGHLLSDSINYQKVSGVFTATGGEQWLIIGNFKDNAHTLTANKINILADNRQLNSIYSIDDVSVTELKTDLIAFTDTSLCTNNALTVILPAGFKDYKWSTGETISQIRVTASGKYTVEASNGYTILQDTFHIAFVDCTVNIPNLITVNGDNLNDYFVIETEVDRTFELTIYNSWGAQIYHNATYQNDWDAENLGSGIYFYYLNDSLLNKNYKGWLQVLK